MSFTPQPFQRGPAERIEFARRAAHIACGDGVVLNALANDLPVTNSAMARRSAAERPAAIEIIGPLSIAASTRSGDIARNARALVRARRRLRGRTRTAVCKRHPSCCGRDREEGIPGRKERSPESRVAWAPPLEGEL